MNKKKIKGFTLIECLVALFIIAIVLATASRSIGVSLNDVQNNYARTVAMWIADNQINQFYLDGIFPELGKLNRTVKMANLEFDIEINISSTNNPYFRKIEIILNEKNKPKSQIYKTITFISQY
jgi:general secretion pathway protein I